MYIFTVTLHYITFHSDLSTSLDSRRDGHGEILNTGGLSKGLTWASESSQENSILKFQEIYENHTNLFFFHFSDNVQKKMEHECKRWMKPAWLSRRCVVKIGTLGGFQELRKTCNVPALNCFYGSTEQGCMPSCFPWLEIHQLKDLFGIGRVTHFLLQLWEGGF